MIDLLYIKLLITALYFVFSYTEPFQMTTKIAKKNLPNSLYIYVNPFYTCMCATIFKKSVWNSDNEFNYFLHGKWFYLQRL